MTRSRHVLAIPRSPEAMRTLRVGRILRATSAEGPGIRFAIWVQGCTLRCPGCCNPQLFPSEGGQEVSVDDVIAKVAAAAVAVEGITLLGGEPFEQAAPLAEIAAASRRIGLSVMTFTGYRMEELLVAPRPGTSLLLAETDLLVDGRYEAAAPDAERRWVGSQNQRFHFLSDRYCPGIEEVGAGGLQRSVEIQLGVDGTVTWNGFPERLGALLRRR